MAGQGEAEADGQVLGSQRSQIEEPDLLVLPLPLREIGEVRPSGVEIEVVDPRARVGGIQREYLQVVDVARVGGIEALLREEPRERRLVAAIEGRQEVGHDLRDQRGPARPGGRR